MLIFFLLESLDLIFFQPVGDGHSDGHQLKAALGHALGFDFAEGDTVTTTFVIAVVARTLEGNEGGLHGIRFDFADNARSVVFQNRVKFLGGNASRFKKPAKDAVFIELRADVQGAAFHGLLQLAAENFVAEL